MKLRKLLVVIDPAKTHQPALQRAQWLAKASGARLELLVCEYDSALEHNPVFDAQALGSVRDALLSTLQQKLEDLAAPLREEGLNVAVHVSWGKPFDQIVLQRVAELQPDILFKSTHHHNALQRLFGNSSWQLLRHCPVPLWLVQHADWQGQRLCAALDPLHSADKPAALDHQLIAAAHLLGSTLNMQAQYLHTFAPVPQSLLFDTELIADYANYSKVCGEEHERTFQQLLKDAGEPLDSGELRQGFAEEEIPRFVREQNIDLLLMGAIARGQLASALIGHSAERVLEAVDCDLLIIKPQPTEA